MRLPVKNKPLKTRHFPLLFESTHPRKLWSPEQEGLSDVVADFSVIFTNTFF